MRTGIGYDIHALVSGRPLVLGGVLIPHETGLDGHSDADVLTHAIIDALLGAAALGDIGEHFPSADPTYRDANSLELLRRAVDLVRDAGYRAINVDATVIAQAPQLSPHIGAMRSALAETIGIEVGAVSVKATTADRLGAIGQGEGIAAMATALVDST